MAPEGKLPKIIGETLREMFKQTVEEPLPPLIQQTIRRLHELEQSAAESTATAQESIKPIKWDLIVPASRTERPRN